MLGGGRGDLSVPAGPSPKGELPCRESRLWRGDLKTHKESLKHFLGLLAFCLKPGVSAGGEGLSDRLRAAWMPQFL